MRNKIGIFGGTFDPPHTEHANMILHAGEEFGLDEIVVVPNGVPPHKESGVEATAKQRCEMAEIAFAGLPRVVLSRYEADSPSPSFTYQTLEHFRAAYGGAELYLILGADSLRDLPKWKCPERIRAAANIIAVPRAGVKADLSGASVTRYRGGAVSSTEIKAALEFGLPAAGLTPEVKRYIAANGLYRTYRRYTDEVKKRVKPARLRHTANVAVKGIELIRSNGLKLDASEVFIACTLHDIAKYVTPEEAVAAGFDAREAEGVPPQVLHSYLGAWLVKRLFPELNQDVVNAVKYHTTFRAGMSPLEKVVALADGIERDRAYPGVEEVRQIAERDLDAACLLFLKQTERYLRRVGRTVAPDALAAIAYFEKLTQKEERV